MPVFCRTAGVEERSLHFIDLGFGGRCGIGHVEDTAVVRARGDLSAVDGDRRWAELILSSPVNLLKSLRPFGVQVRIQSDGGMDMRVLLIGVLLLGACTTTARIARTTPDECDCQCPGTQTAAPIVQFEPRMSSPYQQGQQVEVSFGGRWYPARILSVVAPDIWEVSYDGWDSSYNELVRPSRIRQPRPAQLPGRPIRSLGELQVGMDILVLSGGTWYPGVVRQPPQGEQVLIGYEGYEENWDESVTIERLRLPG